MTTITTKELRESMPKVVDELRRGQPVRLTYRRKLIGVIQPSAAKPAAKSEPKRGTAADILKFLETADFGVPERVRNSKKTIKQELAEMRDSDWRRQ